MNTHRAVTNPAAREMAGLEPEPACQPKKAELDQPLHMRTADGARHTPDKAAKPLRPADASGPLRGGNALNRRRLGPPPF